MNWQATIQGQDWSIRSGGPLGWPLLLSAATTMGHATAFDSGICPDSSSLAHEFYHVIHTSWLRYLASFTIGRIWGSTYWKDEERGANSYQIQHAQDPEFQALAARIRKDIPAQIPLVTVNHPV